MKKRILGVLVATLLVIGIMAPAAMADIYGVAAFAGVAQVGQTFTNDCTKLSPSAPQGKGLGIDPTEQKNGVWRLQTDFTFVGTDQNDTPASSGVYMGRFDVCGWLTAPLDLKPPLGATCVSTKGHHGTGRASAASGTDRIELKVFNVGWKASAGPLLPVIGNYQQYNDTATAKKNKYGSLAGLVVVAPDANSSPTGCLDNAQDSFIVAGAVALGQPEHDFAKSGKKCAGRPSCPTQRK